MVDRERGEVRQARKRVMSGMVAYVYQHTAALAVASVAYPRVGEVLPPPGRYQGIVVPHSVRVEEVIIDIE